MRELKLSPAFYLQFRRRLWSIVVPFLLLVFGILLWVETQWLAQFFGDPSLVYFVLPLAAVAVIIGTIIGVHRVQERWRSYRLVLDNSSITRLQNGSSPVSIRFSEITKISEVPGAGITILASDPPRWIGVPTTTENFQELRYELAQVHLIESVPHAHTRGHSLLVVGIFLATTISMLVALVAPDRLVSIISSCVLIAILVWSIIAIQRNPYATTQQRRNSWLTFPVLAVVVGWVLFRLFRP